MPNVWTRLLWLLSLVGAAPLSAQALPADSLFDRLIGGPNGAPAYEAVVVFGQDPHSRGVCVSLARQHGDERVRPGG